MKNSSLLISIILLIANSPQLLVAQNLKEINILSQKKVGSASNAKSIDGTGIYPFTEGLAVVTKNKSEAIIDANGNFIIPYNKWKFTEHSNMFGKIPVGFVNGSCVVQGLQNEGYGLIDTSGKIIIPCENIIAFPFDNYGLATIVKKTTILNKYNVVQEVSSYYFVNRKNKEMEVPKPFLRQLDNVEMDVLFLPSLVRNLILSKGIVDKEFTMNGVSIGKSDKGYSVFNFKGEPISDNYFTNARHFSEGLAAVSRTDEFGETKWGFIDEKGRIVIPLKFSNEPGDFMEGLAFVIPKDQSEFHYAYIDKTGEIVLTIKHNFEQNQLGSSWDPLPTSLKRSSYYAKMGCFQNNFAFIPYDYDHETPFILINKAGENQMKYMEAMLGEAYITRGHNSYNSSYFMLNDGQLVLQNNCLLDLKRNFFIPPGIFDELSLFDPTSNLAKAIRNNIVGYINREGQFVIVIANQKSKW